MWFPLNVLSHPVSFLIFNCFDGSSKTTPFSIRKYSLIMLCSCRVSLLVFFNKYPWRVLQCHFFKVIVIVYFSVLSKITISDARVSPSILLIFNKHSFRYKISLVQLTNIHHSNCPRLNKAHRRSVTFETGKIEFDLHDVIVGARHGGCSISEMVYSVTTVYRSSDSIDDEVVLPDNILQWNTYTNKNKRAMCWKSSQCCSKVEQVPCCQLRTGKWSQCCCTMWGWCKKHESMANGSNSLYKAGLVIAPQSIDVSMEGVWWECQLTY